MKPSQFKRIEKAALKQRTDFITEIGKATKLGMNIASKERTENLNNLIGTMKDLKKDISKNH